MNPRPLAALLVLSFNVTKAEESGEPLLLAPWVVSASPLSSDDPTAHASALVPAATWSNRSIATLADAFRQIPGVTMQESFGGFEPPRLSIRGSGVQSAPSSRGVSLLLDQLPLGLADGSFNSALFDPLLGSQLQVQRGLDGWRAAPGTAGGALDLRSTPPARDLLHAEAGSFGAFRLHGRLHHADTSLAFSSTHQDGYREHSEQARTALLATQTAPLGAATSAAFTLYHVHARYEVPGPLTLATSRVAPRSISADVRRDDPERVSAFTRVSAALRRTSHNSTAELALAFARTDDDFRQLTANGISRSQSDDASLRAAYTRHFPAAPIPHQLQLSATATRGWRDIERFPNQSAQPGPSFGRDALDPATGSLQIQDTLALSPTVAASVGIAQIAARRDISDRSHTGPSTDLNLSTSATLPQAGLRWRCATDTTVFLNAFRVAEPPTFDDLLVVGGVPPALVRRTQSLATQRALTWELGARGRAGRFSWDVAAYHAAWRDEILRLADERGLPRGAVNATPTTHEGLEASFRYTLLDQRLIHLTLVASAVWTHFTFDGDPVYSRNRLAGTPPHLGNAELLAELPRGGFLAFGADWTAGATPVDHAGRLASGGRTLLHLRAGVRLRRDWTAFVEVRNLLDRASIASTAGVLDLARNPAATTIFLPAPARSLTLGLTWTP